MSESRARYSNEQASNMIGNKFDLVLIASLRTRELKKGVKPKIQCEDGPTVTALKEIEQGLIGREYLKRIRK